MTAQNPHGEERRKEPRFPASCRCWLEQDSMTLLGTATNLSHSGMFLRTLPLVSEGSVVEVKLTIDQGVVTAKGEVRWASKPERTTPGETDAPGLGITFLEVIGGQDLLSRFVERSALSFDS
jgi:hypothetical protein